MKGTSHSAGTRSTISPCWDEEISASLKERISSTGKSAIVVVEEGQLPPLPLRLSQLNLSKQRKLLM